MAEAKRFGMPDTECPECRHPINGAVDIDGKGVRPKPDDITICVWCAEPLMYAPDLTVTAVSKRVREWWGEDWVEVEREVARVKSLLPKGE